MQQKIPFVILTITRSGSTWLVSLLDEQPDLVSYGELFFDQPGQTFIEKHQAPTGSSPPRFHHIKAELGRLGPLRPHRYLGRVRECAADKRAYGFKLMLHSRSLPVLATLALHRYRLICLIRDNVFEGAMSRLVMDMTGDAHGETAAAPEQRLRVDPEALVREMKKRRRGIDGLRLVARLWPWPKLVVRYGELQARQQETLQQVLDLLQLPAEARAVVSPLVRRIQKPYEELLVNIEEIVAAIERERLADDLPSSLRRQAGG